MSVPNADTGQEGNNSAINPSTSDNTSGGQVDMVDDSQQPSCSTSVRSRNDEQDNSMTTKGEEEENLEELGGEYEEDENNEEEDDDTTISSEAVVDDIELILMPEETQDLSFSDMSPQLVRVTELNRERRCDEDDMQDDDYDREGDSCRKFESFSADDYYMMNEEEEEDGPSVAEDDSTEREDEEGRRTVLLAEELGDSHSDRVHSQVQTDITALDDVSFVSEGYKSKGNKSKTTKIGRRLNWKSEMTLLPSKPKVKQGVLERNKSDIDYEDESNQYSPRVSKFTSQVKIEPFLHE